MSGKNPREPLASNPFKRDLKELKKKLTDEEERAAADEKAKQEAAKAKGIRETPKRSAPAQNPAPARPKLVAPKLIQLHAAGCQRIIVCFDREQRAECAPGLAKAVTEALEAELSTL